MALVAALLDFHSRLLSPVLAVFWTLPAAAFFEDTPEVEDASLGLQERHASTSPSTPVLSGLSVSATKLDTADGKGVTYGVLVIVMSPASLS